MESKMIKIKGRWEIMGMTTEGVIITVEWFFIIVIAIGLLGGKK